ncbi:MAG: M20/M25/M40 family metallo-hydrolase [Chloroflexi bacterium]|nr:M20/M25/M40 family metallo-hydrolase [Chloroflexota bacterium]
MSDGYRDAAIRTAVLARRPLVEDATAYIHGHPELAHAEYDSAAYLANTLEEFGLTVERGIAGMSTAFRATLQGGLPGRTVGLVSNYDAVPSVPSPGAIEPIHACGHGPIAAGVLAAVSALAEDRDRLRGRVVVMGCPADEIHSPGTIARGGGKAISAAAGAWDGIDAALYAHPEFLDTVWAASAWMRRDIARIHGTRTLVSGADQSVLSAVGGVIAAATAAPAAQVMLETLELDGDVEEGTSLGAVARFLLWAPDAAGISDLASGLRAALPAEWETGQPVPGIRPDPAVGASVADAHRVAGRDFVEPPMPLPFATDFGSISLRVPAALIGLGHPGGWAFHTREGAAQFASPDGVLAGLDLATVLALATERLTAPD